MKKLLLIFVLFVLLIGSVSATEYFYDSEVTIEEGNFGSYGRAFCHNITPIETCGYGFTFNTKILLQAGPASSYSTGVYFGLTNNSNAVADSAVSFRLSTDIDEGGSAGNPTVQLASYVEGNSATYDLIDGMLANGDYYSFNINHNTTHFNLEVIRDSDNVSMLNQSVGSVLSHIPTRFCYWDAYYSVGPLGYYDWKPATTYYEWFSDRNGLDLKGKIDFITLETANTQFIITNANSINNMTAYFNSTSYSTTNGTINTGVLSTEIFNITIESDEGSYFNRTYLNHNLSNNLQCTFYQGIINISINETYSGNPVTNWTIYNCSEILINTTDYWGVFYGLEGEYNNITLESNNGFFTTKSLNGFNITAFDNKTIFYELLTINLNVTANSVISGLPINNFTLYYSNNDNSHSGYFNTTDGEIVFGVIDGDTYNISIDAEGYALWNHTVFKYINGNTNHTFELYTNNSISFEVRWEDSNSLVTNFTEILLTSPIVTYNFSTTNGTIYADNIIDGTYSVKASLGTLEDKYYIVSVANRSHQDLTIYFDYDYNNVTFLFQDKNTGTTIEGVYFSMSRFVNGSLTVVSSKLSDITGVVSTTYVPGVYYVISGSKIGYETKSFSIDPINSALYIVKMDSSTDQIYINDGVSVYYYPNTFVGGSNNFSFIINSPLGLLSSYWLNISYPGGNNYYSGTESLGELFDFSFNISNPSIYDNVKVEYYYLTSLSDTDNNVFYHPINFINASSSAWANFTISYGDLGIFERIIIVVLCVILVSGFGYLIAGFGGSLAMGLLIYVFFAATGFIPLWTILISLLVGGILIFRGGIFG